MIRLAEEAAAVAAEKEQDNDPAEIPAETASAVMFEASVATSAVSAAAAQNQDQEN